MTLLLIEPDTLSIHKRFVVSFVSFGNGINNKGIIKIQEYVHEFEKEKSIRIDVNEECWGKEGEIDYCFDLSLQSIKNRKSFINGINKVASELDRINIRFAEQCRNRF